MLLERDEEEKLAPRTRSIGWRLVFLVLVLLGAFATVWHWERLDPFATDQRNIREAQGLMEITRTRRLTDDEIERVVALLHCGTEAAQLSAIVTLRLVVGREPGKRDRAVEALEGCPETASPTVREVASQLATELKTPQKQADELQDKALHRRLTDDEFERVVALMSTEPPSVQLSAILTLQVAVGHDPGRRDRAIAALEGCPQTASPKVRQEASQAATQLKGPQKKPLIQPNLLLHLTRPRSMFPDAHRLATVAHWSRGRTGELDRPVTSERSTNGQADRSSLRDKQG